MENERKTSPLPGILSIGVGIGILVAAVCWLLDSNITLLDPRFEGRETIELSDRSGPDVGVAGSAAREEELDRLRLLVAHVYPHWEKEIEDPGSGRTVRVRVKTPLPWRTRRELRSIRRDYEAGDPWPEIRALAFGDYAKRPFGVEFDKPCAGVPIEPRFLRYARRVLASPRELVVPRLLELALSNPADYSLEGGLDTLTVHVLLCAALRVPDVPSTNAWQGVRIANERADFKGRTSDGWWGWWNDEPDRDARIASFWEPFRDELAKRPRRRRSAPASKPAPSVLDGGVTILSKFPEQFPEGACARLADHYGFLVTTNGAEQIFARAHESGRFIVPCRADPAPKTIRLGPDDGVVVELAPGAPESALDELLSRIHAAPESCVHVVLLRALDAPGSETEGEHAEGAEPKSHAESAESAETRPGEAGPLPEGAAERSDAGGVFHAESAENAE